MTATGLAIAAVAAAGAAAAIDPRRCTVRPRRTPRRAVTCDPTRDIPHDIAWPRHPARAATLLATCLLAAAALGACGPSGPSATAAAATGSAPASGPAASAGAGAPSSAPSPTAPADRLADSFAAMAGGYTYTATVTVGADTVSTATGRSVGGASEFVLATGGTSVTYRAVPPRAWVQQPGEAWVEVSGQVPPGSPLEALTASTAITVVSDAPDALVVDAAYPASALGLAGSDAVTVRLSVAPEGTITAAFQTLAGDRAAVSTSVFTPAAGLEPIVAP